MVRKLASRNGVGSLLLATTLALAVVVPAFADAEAGGPVRREGHTIEIAPRSDALTFARIGSPDGPRVLGVIGYREGTLTAIDLSRALGSNRADPISLFLDEGYEGLKTRMDRADPEQYAVVAATDLTLPVDLGDHHIAAGTNFPEHAGETDVEDGPFLFPKIVEPTGPHAMVAAGTALLDYEVELAWVTLTPIEEGEVPDAMGLILCNDYTDRATLLRHLDPMDVASGAGFTTGKSFSGFLPIGDLFVIPRDYRAFAMSLELSLSVNGELRQHSAASEMIWEIDRLLEESWERRETTWLHRGHEVSLYDPSNGIGDRVLLMSGTPAGTTFRGVDLAAKLGALFDWLAGGWGRSIPDHAIDRYLTRARRSGAYLQRGDQVRIRVDRLGVIENTIVDPAQPKAR